MGLLAGFVGGPEASAQYVQQSGAADRFLSRTAPYLPMGSGEPADYNIKWRRVTARLRGSLQVEYADNLTLTEEDARGDVFLGPSLGAGIFWPVSQHNLLQFDLDVGYRHYFEYDDLSTFYVSPASHLEYRVMAGDVRINLHDDFSIQVDPVSRPEISGVPGQDPVVFRRFLNTAGLSASWQPAEHWTVVAGYDYTIDCSLSDDYASIDRDTHLVSGAVYRVVPPQWTFGVRASASWTDYWESIQNDGSGLSFGPLVALQASPHLLLDAGVSWTQSNFRDTGTIQDQSDFDGLTFYGGVTHQFNRRMDHNLRVSRTVGLGLGSNYTDMVAVQYGLRVEPRRGLSVNGVFGYDHSQVSGVGGESADRYLAYVGTGLDLSRHWRVGLGYSFAWKNSDQAGRDYVQNRVTAEFTYLF